MYGLEYTVGYMGFRDSQDGIVDIPTERGVHSATELSACQQTLVACTV